MKTKLHFGTLILLLGINSMYAQNIGDFTSVTPNTPTSQFVIPSSHNFQRIIEVGDPLTVSGTMLIKPDFTGYVPIGASSTNGYLSINSEAPPIQVGGPGGGVTVLDINFNGTSKLWETTASQTISFAGVGNTAANCSGTVTPWGTVISSEELAYFSAFLVDTNSDGHNDYGWNVEINPATKMVIGKHYAMGNMAHENVAIKTINSFPTSRSVVYQGADSNPGYLYKYVATNFQDLSSGNLYVYSGSKNGTGAWVQLANTTATERNTTIALSNAAGGTVFNGIEDVEVGPDGLVYFAVKNEGRVYRFSESDPLEASASTVTMETFVGGMSYDINDGSSTSSVPWGNGNDNLAFDNQGNLWVFQDGGNFYIWVVGSNHDQNSAIPVIDVRLFGITPAGAEPTGITFTPDNKYLFMSVLVLNDPTTNNANQTDAAGNSVDFNTGTTIVVALNENLGTALSVAEVDKIANNFQVTPNPLKSSSKEVSIKGNQIHNIKMYSILGKQLMDGSYNNLQEVKLNLKDLQSGLYLLKINNSQTLKLVIK